MSPKSHGTPRWVDYDLENQSLGRDWLSCRRSMIAGISESALLSTRCNVLSVPITIWPRMCLSELMRSAHCRSTQRWTLNGYMTLIRPTSLDTLLRLGSGSVAHLHEALGLSSTDGVRPKAMNAP